MPGLEALGKMRTAHSIGFCLVARIGAMEQVLRHRHFNLTKQRHNLLRAKSLLRHNQSYDPSHSLITPCSPKKSKLGDYHHRPAAKILRTQPAGKRLTVYSRQLAL
jgi:hypothetical protein